MLRKLIMFAITSGLAKKAWDHYRQRQARDPPPVRPAGTGTPPAATNRATTVGAGQV
jgi:hypothetical protein